MNEITGNSALRRIFRTVYYLTLAVPFLWQMPILLGLSVAFPIQEVFRPLLFAVMAMAATGLWLTGSRTGKWLGRDGGLLLLAYLWMIVVFLLHRYVLYEAELILLRAGIAWLAFYPFGYLLDEDEIRKGLNILAVCWTGVMTVLALIGIFCAVTRTGMKNLSDNLSFGMIDKRLKLGIWSTSTAENLLTACIMAAVGILFAKKRWQRISFGAAMAALFTAMVLTDGRNGIISLGIFVGAIVFVALLHRFAGKKALGFCAGAAAAILCVVLVYTGAIQLQKQFPGTYQHVSSMREMIIAPFLPEAQPETVPAETLPQETEPLQPQMQAAAEQTAAVTLLAAVSGPVVEPAAAVTAQDDGIPHRKIESTLNSRKMIWQGAWDAFRKNEDNILLLGRPGTLCLETFRKQSRFMKQAEHLHNIYLQVIAEWGIPGAAIMVSFLVLFASAAFRLIFAGGISFRKRLLPIPAVVILISELVDAFTRFEQENVAVYVLFLFMGLTISCSRRIRK